MASAVLTPLVTRLLRSFIRSSEGSDASSLKVSFSSRGTLLLQHLELNLDSLLPGLNVRRARAGALEITIPWTSLASQPIQVVLTGVDIELGPPDLDQKRPERAASERAEAPPASTTSWLSALQSWLLRAMCNLSITLKHVSLRWADASGACTAHCAFQSLEFFTDDIPSSMEAPEAWLAKRAQLTNLSVSVQDPGQPQLMRNNMIVIPQAAVSLLAPIFAFIEGWEAEDEEGGKPGDLPSAFVHLTLTEPRLTFVDRQIHVLQGIIGQLQANAQSKRNLAPEYAEPEVVAPPQVFQKQKEVLPPSLRGSMAARVWGYITNEEAVHSPEQPGLVTSRSAESMERSVTQELNPELSRSPSVTLLGSVSGGKKETDPLLAAFSELILRLKARMQVGFTIQGAEMLCHMMMGHSSVSHPLARLTLPLVELGSLWRGDCLERVELALAELVVAWNLGVRSETIAQKPSTTIWQEALALRPANRIKESGNLESMDNPVNDTSMALRLVAVNSRRSTLRAGNSDDDAQVEPSSSSLDFVVQLGWSRLAISAEMLSLLSETLNGGNNDDFIQEREQQAQEEAQETVCQNAATGDNKEEENNFVGSRLPNLMGSAEVECAKLEIAYELQQGSWIVAGGHDLNGRFGAVPERGRTLEREVISPRTEASLSSEQRSGTWSLRLPITCLRAEHLPFLGSSNNLEGAEAQLQQPSIEHQIESGWLEKPILVRAMTYPQAASSSLQASQTVSITAAAGCFAVSPEQAAIVLNRVSTQQGFVRPWLRNACLSFKGISARRGSNDSWVVDCPAISLDLGIDADAGLHDDVNGLSLRLSGISWQNHTPCGDDLSWRKLPEAPMNWCLSMPTIEIGLTCRIDKSARDFVSVASIANGAIESFGLASEKTVTCIALEAVYSTLHHSALSRLASVASALASRPIVAGDSAVEVERQEAAAPQETETWLDVGSVKFSLEDETIYNGPQSDCGVSVDLGTMHARFGDSIAEHRLAWALVSLKSNRAEDRPWQETPLLRMGTIARGDMKISSSESAAIHVIRMQLDDHDRVTIQLDPVFMALHPGALCALQSWAAVLSIPASDAAEPLTIEQKTNVMSSPTKTRQIRLSCKGINLHLVEGRTTNDDEHQLMGIWLASDDLAVTILSSPAAPDGRPWLPIEATWTQLDITVLGVTLALTRHEEEELSSEDTVAREAIHNGVLPFGHVMRALCLAPCDARIEGARLEVPCTVSEEGGGAKIVNQRPPLHNRHVTVAQAHLAMVKWTVSSAHVIGLQRVVTSLKDVIQAPLAKEEDHPSAIPVQNPSLRAADDLIAGLFCLELSQRWTETTGNSLAPLRLRTWIEESDDGTGVPILCLQWRYPRPRAVHAVAFKALASEVVHAGFELFGEASEHEGGGIYAPTLHVQESMTMPQFIDQSLADADLGDKVWCLSASSEADKMKSDINTLWTLRWQSKTLTLGRMLAHLRINCPADCSLRRKREHPYADPNLSPLPPLGPALSAGLSVSSMTGELLGQDGRPLLALQARDLHMAAHSFEAGALAGSLRVDLSVQVIDPSTRTLLEFLEPSVVCIQASHGRNDGRRQCRSPTSINATTFASPNITLEEDKLDLLSLRMLSTCPEPGHLAVDIATKGLTRVNIWPWTLAGLKAVASGLRLSEPKAVISSPPLTLVNSITGLTILAKQQRVSSSFLSGMPSSLGDQATEDQATDDRLDEEAMTIAPGRSFPFVWQLAPREVRGARRRLHFALVNPNQLQTTSDCKDMIWSEPVDVMTQGERWVVAPLARPDFLDNKIGIPLQVTCTTAAGKDDCGLRINVSPGLSIVNDTAWPLTFSLSTRSTDERVHGSGSAPEPEVRVLRPYSVTRCVVPCPLPGGPRSEIMQLDEIPRSRVWLDGGWSRPIDLDSYATAQLGGVLDRDWRRQPAPPFLSLSDAEEEGTWLDNRAQGVSVSGRLPAAPCTLLWGAQLRGSAAQVGRLRFSAPARLRNDLPFALDVLGQGLLSPPSRSGAGGGSPTHSSTGSLPPLDACPSRLQPGQTLDLGVSVAGGIACLVASADGHEGMPAGWFNGSGTRSASNSKMSLAHHPGSSSSTMKPLAIILPPLVAGGNELSPAPSAVGQAATASLLGLVPIQAARPGEYADCVVAVHKEEQGEEEKKHFLVPCRLSTEEGTFGSPDTGCLLLRLTPRCLIRNELNVAIALGASVGETGHAQSPSSRRLSSYNDTVCAALGSCAAGVGLGNGNHGLAQLDSGFPPSISLSLYPNDQQSMSPPFTAHDIVLEPPTTTNYDSSRAPESQGNWSQHVVLRRDENPGRGLLPLETVVVLRVCRRGPSPQARGWWELTLTYALHLSNLFEASIWVRASSAAIDLEESQSPGGGAPWQALLEEGSTRGLLLGVAAVYNGVPAPRHTREYTERLGPEKPLSSRHTSPLHLPLPRLRFALGQTGGCDNEFLWSSLVVPGQTWGRQRLYLVPSHQGEESRTPAPHQMVTWRVIESEDKFHLVLFRDRQPPGVVENHTKHPIAVGIAWVDSCQATRRDLARPIPHTRFLLAPGTRVECELFPHRLTPEVEDPSSPIRSPRRQLPQQTAWDDSEDEDAFLDGLQPHPDSSPVKADSISRAEHEPKGHAVICIRRENIARNKASKALSDSTETLSQHSSESILVLESERDEFVRLEEEGLDEDVLGAKLTWRCGGAYVTLISKAAAGEDDEASSAAVEPPMPKSAVENLPFSTSISASLCMDHVEVSFWDDERGILSELSPDTSGVNGWEAFGSSFPMASGHGAGAEVAALTLKKLRLELSRSPIASVVDDEQRPPRDFIIPTASQPAVVSYGVSVGARALQLDVLSIGGAATPVLRSLPPQEAAHSMSFEEDERHKVLIGGAHLGVSRPDEPQTTSFWTTLQLHRALSTPIPRPASFRNTWVQHANFRLPPLALCVDDGVARLAERAQRAFQGWSTGPEEQDAEQSSCPPDNGALAESPSVIPRLATESGSLELLQLQVEAAGAAASRLYLADCRLSAICVLLDVHLPAGTAGLPVALDTQAAPLLFSPLSIRGALFRPHVLARGLAAHALAEALLGAPRMLGSLALLFNPTGLVSAVRKGVWDMWNMPLAAVAQGKSAGHVLAGVGLGSASLLRNVSAWTLMSISGFSYAAARAVDGAVASGTMVPAFFGATTTHGRSPSMSESSSRSLEFASNTSIVTSSHTTANKATMLGAIGRSVLAPLTGALGLLGAVTAGIASSAGLTDEVVALRPLRRMGSSPRLCRTGVPWENKPLNERVLRVAASRLAMMTSSSPDKSSPGAVVPVVCTAEQGLAELWTPCWLVIQVLDRPTTLLSSSTTIRFPIVMDLRSVVIVSHLHDNSREECTLVVRGVVREHFPQSDDQVRQVEMTLNTLDAAVFVPLLRRLSWT